MRGLGRMLLAALVGALGLPSAWAAQKMRYERPAAYMYGYSPMYTPSRSQKLKAKIRRARAAREGRR